MTASPGKVVERFLEREAAEGRVTLLGRTERAWDLLVPSYWKETVALTLELGERSLRAEAFFMRAPDEDPGPAYRLLLERNAAIRMWRFAAGEGGDVALLADVPVACVTEEALDQLIGGLVTITDETYRPYFQRAFRRALEEQVARGGPGLSGPPPWASDWDRPRGG